MFIVPQDRPLFVAARVPVTHCDESRIGHKVLLVFSSLPSCTPPEISGKVNLVSADALSDERSLVTYLRAKIALDAADLATKGGVATVPGMAVEAYIKTTDRTPLFYLFKRFANDFRTAFREA